jgi:hypothetical protein
LKINTPVSELFAAPYLELLELPLISYVYVKQIENILPLSRGLGQGKVT